MITLTAHLTKKNGIKVEQTLKEHCRKTAEYAAESIGNPKLYHIVYLAGMLHDMGKAKQEYVQYLEDAYNGKEVIRGSVNHTFAGVIWIFEKFHTNNLTKWEQLTCEIIGFAIGSHHGMFDCVDLDGKNGFIYRLKKDKKELCYEETIQNYFTQVIEETVVLEYFNRAVQEVKEFFYASKERYHGADTFYQISMLARLVLSSVIYGDRKDTYEFMKQKNTAQELEIRWSDRKNYFEAKLSQLNSSSDLDQVRKDISKQCLESANRPSGIYQLNVPTGAGKTLSALRYALAHTEKYKKKRIIFIIPLLSVLDQNVKVIKDYVSEKGEVLEHHSNVIQENSEKDELDQFELLAESWNYPIVVSTLVQLLNILFGYRSSEIKRLQALCNSVIIIDEVQTLPKRITAMFNLSMNFLQQFCNATIVLSSATQPCFEELKWSLHLSDKPNLVSLSRQQIQMFQRAEIVNKVNTYGMDLEECREFLNELIKQHRSLLVVCNTKAEARELFEEMRKYIKSEDCDIYHLSTAMCQKHRMDILEKVQSKLNILQKSDKKDVGIRKLICISTQLVEAGIDFSFEGVVRVLAGIDNLAQAAGCCNRNNEYGQLGKVYLINLKNENLSMLDEIKDAQNSTRTVINYFCKREENSLIGEEATRMFYRILFQNTNDYEFKYPIKETICLKDLLSNINGSAETKENEDYILHQPFKMIGKEFKVFDQDTVDVIVPYEEGITLIEQLKNVSLLEHLTELKKMVWEAKPYMVQIYEGQKEKLKRAGVLKTILDENIFILEEKAYDGNYGVTF